MEAPAYYEVGVDQGGYIVVSTGAHDVPVPHWSDEGEPISAALRAQAAERGVVARRLYKLDSLAYAAEDDREELAAEIGAHALGKPARAIAAGDTSPTWPTWRMAKKGYADMFAPDLAHARETAAPAWRRIRPIDAPLVPGVRVQSDEYKQGKASVDADETFWATSSELLKTQIKWRQEHVDGCAVGCGPVAWGQVTAYMNHLAEAGNPYYRDQLGAQRLYAGGLAYDDTAKLLVRTLHDRLGTHCIDGQGATTMWGMNEYDDWARSQGANIKLSTDMFWDQEDTAEKWLRRNKPVVVGTGFYAHYPVAVGLAMVKVEVDWWFDHTDKYIWVNQGWGGSGNGWINLDVFYAAAAVPMNEAERAAQTVTLEGLGEKCMEVAGGFTASGTPVQLYDCNGTASQVWKLYPSGEIRGLANKCLDVRGGQTANRTPLQLFDCNGSASQHFQLNRRGELRGLGDKCVEVKGGFTDNKTPIQLYDCNGTASQIWKKHD
jgi:hypothetical protein